MYGIQLFLIRRDQYGGRADQNVVEIPLEETARSITVGRHSSLLYWSCGNNARLSRHLLQLTGYTQRPLDAPAVHPDCSNVALQLQCTDKNNLVQLHRHGEITSLTAGQPVWLTIGDHIMVDKVALDVFCVSVVEGKVSGPPLCRHEASPPCITVHRDTILTRREKLELIYAMCRDRFQRAASLVLESTEKVSDSVECPNSVASTTALDHSAHTIDEETNEEVVEAATPHSQSLQKTVTRSHLSQRTVCPKSSASKNVEYSSSALRFSSGSGKERPHTMESTYSETYDGFLIDALVELEKNAHDIGEQVHMALDKERKEAEPDLSGLIGEESEVKLERRSQKRKSQSKKPSPTKERRSLKKSPRAASRHTATMKSARPDHAGRVRDSLVNFSDVLFDSPTDWLNNIVLPSAQQANEESQEVFFQH